VIESPPKLVYAHFPLRSKAQLMGKVVPNRIAQWKRPISVWHGDGFQYRLIWDNIKKNGEVSQSLVQEHSIVYSVEDWRLAKIMPEIGDSKLVEGKMDVSFCSDKLDLRYTDYGNMEKTFLRATLSEIEATVMFLLKGKRAEIKMQGAKRRVLAKIHGSGVWKALKKLQDAHRFLIRKKG
jgi:hypothetical protein